MTDTRADHVAHFLDILAETTNRLAEIKVETDQLYALRLRIYQDLRGLDPPVLLERIAGKAGVTEVAITAALNKDRRRAETR